MGVTASLCYAQRRITSNFECYGSFPAAIGPRLATKGLTRPAFTSTIPNVWLRRPRLSVLKQLLVRRDEMRGTIALLCCLCFLAACHTRPAGPAPDRKTAIEPLPDERVQEMFDRIRKNEKIELTLVYQALIGPQTALRADAARYLGDHGDETSIPHLINALGDESMHVGANYPQAGMATTRYWTNESLKKLTGKDFGFMWNDPKEKREGAIARWRAWYQRTYKKDLRQGSEGDAVDCTR